MIKALLFLYTTILLAAQIFGQTTVKIKECIIENGILKEVQANYNTVTGEKSLMFNGANTSFEKIGETGDYAAKAAWYINNEPIPFLNFQYEKYGLPRILGVNEITKAGVYKGVGVYVEAGQSGAVEIIYIPVRPGCEFQPYQRKLPPCGQVSIIPSLKKVKKGKNVSFVAKLTGAKAAVTCKWICYSGTIIGASNKKTVVVSSINAYPKVEVELVIENTNCQSTGYAFVDITN